MNLAGGFRFSSSLVAILDAGDGRVVDVNPAFERELGYSRDAMLGRSTLEIDFWPHPQTRATIWAHLRSEHRVCGERVVFRNLARSEFAANLYCEFFEHEGRRLVLAVFQRLESAAAQDAPVEVDPGSYRSLFMSSAEGFYRSLPEGGLIDVNPALARIFGYESPAQMLSEAHDRRARDLYADPAVAVSLIERLHADGHFENQRVQIRRRDGSVVWISENSRCVRDGEGHLLFYEGSIMDIGAQVEAEERLRQSENMYRTLVDSSHDGVFLIRHDGSIGFINEAMAQTLGYRADELIGTNYLKLIAPEAMAEQTVRRNERAGGSYAVQTYDTVMIRKDGTRRLLHVHAGAVDYEGEVASTGTARDVTEEHRQREALEWAERTYRELFQNAVSGMFRSRLDGRIVAANDAFARILGYADASELLESGRGIGDFYANPESRKYVLAQLAASREPVTFEFDACRKDGSMIPTEVRAQAIRDNEGRIVWTEGSAQDISARRRAEIALKDSEARYRTLVEHSQVGVYMMLEDRYTYVNAAFAALFGYREDELVGADFRLLVPPESLEHQEDRYRRRSGGEPSNGDYCIVLMRKDGARIQVVVSAGQVEMHGKRYTSGTIRDVTAQLRVQRELEHNASHDQLTGLSNRVYFERQLEQAIAHAHASGDYHYAVLFLDLDGFKLVNDSLGHASGDDLLMQIAETLSANLGTQCLVARYGGDEFTLLPHGVCPRGRAEQLAQRVLALLAGSFEVRGHRVFSGASVGVVLGHADYQSPDQLLRDADTAMYRAKAGGKSAYVIFDDAMHAAARARLKLETDLRFAVERGEFRIFHQPIVDLRSGRVQGFEALVRWEHPQRGLLLPSEFLEVAGETGTLVALDWWVLEQVCQNLLRWQRRLPAHARLRASVNVDDRQFADRNLIEHLRNVLRRTGADPSTLALEITETVFRRGREEAAQTLHGLKQLGVSLVVDDFGTGYSSLDSFADSPFDALKIDRSFVRDMVTNFRHRAIVRTIAAFAEDMRLDLIAEGVETAEQANLLRDLGCTVAQGFLYAPALPLEEFEALLERGFARQSDSPPSAVA
ncbi:MAG TPA: PAS domain S-box protein [Rudaea sp.]|jgi:diguanylate cyclase (GGDEF)-like protein/PAS domain S-box-containing protein|nr:PAS domain S-box protein [Rudaea sp.]